jgi:hypothetical protein
VAPIPFPKRRSAARMKWARLAYWSTSSATLSWSKAAAQDVLATANSAARFGSQVDAKSVQPPAALKHFSRRLARSSPRRNAATFMLQSGFSRPSSCRGHNFGRVSKCPRYPKASELGRILHRHRSGPTTEARLCECTSPRSSRMMAPAISSLDQVQNSGSGIRDRIGLCFVHRTFGQPVGGRFSA